MGIANRTFTYDNTGKMTSFGGTSMTYNNRGQLTGFGTKTLTYDNYGNRLTKGNESYTWTRGRLLASFDNVSFTYDYQGRRYTKTASGVTSTYYYNGTTLMGENRGNNKLRYFYDQTGINGFTYNGTQYGFAKDIQGNVVAIFQGMTPVARYIYDAWGNHKVLNPDGTEIANSLTTHIGNINPFRYRGYYYDSETELYYLMTRYYDPEIGQFLSPDSFTYLDPIDINGINLYCYCYNNPVMYVDPTGHFALTAVIIGAIIGVVVGAGVGFGVTAYVDYQDDGQVFNGSIGAGSYVANTLIAAFAGGVLGAGIGAWAPEIATFLGSTYTFTIGGGMAGYGVATAGVSISISGAQVAELVGALGLVLFARIGKSGGYRIDHHYPNDHDPTHVHISGDDGMTRVDINGNPIQGDRPMTHGEKKAFWKLIQKIREALAPWL